MSNVLLIFPIHLPPRGLQPWKRNDTDTYPGSLSHHHATWQDSDIRGSGRTDMFMEQQINNSKKIRKDENTLLDDQVEREAKVFG